MALVVSVGAGSNQVPLIRRLKQLGHRVAAFDLDSNAPGVQESDFFEAISTREFHDACRWIESLSERPQAIGCFSYGKAVATSLSLAHHFNLPGAVDPERAAVMHDKQRQRELLRDAGLVVPGEPVNGGLAVVKQRNTSGASHGVHVLPTAEARELDDCTCEAFIQGDEHRVAGWFHRGVLLWTGVLRRWNRPGSCLAARYLALEAAPAWAVDVARRVAYAAEMASGLVKADVMLTRDGPVVIEADLGICGDHLETEFAPAAWGLDLIDAYIELINDRRPCFCPIVGHWNCLDYIYCEAAARVASSPSKVAAVRARLAGSHQIAWLRTKRIPADPKSNMDAVAAIIHSSPHLPPGLPGRSQP